MGFKKGFNRFLQVIYRLFASSLLVLAIVLVIVVSIIVASNFEVNRFLLILFIVAIIAVFFYFWKNKKKIAEENNKNTSINLFFEILKLSFGVILFLFFILNIYKPSSSKTIPKEEDETVILYKDSSNLEVSKYYLSHQTWKDFNNNKHSMAFKVNYQDVINSKNNRDAFRVTHQFSWGIFYKYLVDYDKPFIEELALTFYNYQKENAMSRRDFAELIISSIQDIPYNLITSKDCKETDVKPCFGNINMGVYAPAEFLSNLRADCDTRTVMIYTLLSRFNFDVAILNSENYKHSVLGINIPSTGKFIKRSNKKYYFVETTARGCPIGYLHKDFSNINYWEFALTQN